MTDTPSSALAVRLWTGRFCLIAGLGLVGLKLWLVAGQTMVAVGHAEYDDMLFLRLADALLHGEWLGTYNHLTLAKGPMYSFFIAAAYTAGVPLFVAHHLLYATACGLFVCALRPLAPKPVVRFALFAVLLFNPVSYDALIHMRVLRQQIVHSEVLLILAGLIALYARHREPLHRLLPWAVLTGATLSAFVLTREEWVWLLPCVLPLWAAAVGAVWLARAVDRTRRLLVLVALPLGPWAAGPLLVAFVNYRHYGVFITCEFNQRDFKDAMGALMRVEPLKWQPYLPVPAEVRQRLYPLSPALAGLRSELDGPTGESWASLTESLTGRPNSEHEIGGGWFMWALRRAVNDRGLAHNGAEAAAFYGKLAAEVNAACDSGKIPAGPRRSGFLPPLRQEHFKQLPVSLRNAAEYFVTFNDMDARSLWQSAGSPAELALIARLTRTRSNQDPTTPHQRWLDRMRVHALGRVLQVYQFFAPWAGGLALLMGGFALGTAFARRRWSYFGLLGVGLLGACAANCLIVALIDATSFPSLNTGYFTGAYALWLLLIFAGPLALLETRRRDQPPASGRTGLARHGHDLPTKG